MPPHRRYDEPASGEWVQPVRRGYKMACCDCGLVHNLNFRVRRGRAQFCVFRNNRSTAMIRRHMGGRMSPVKETKLKGGKVRVSTPGGVKAKATTPAKAKAQERLLRGVEHGWKPTGKPAKRSK